MNEDEWRNTKAADRIKLYNELADAFGENKPLVIPTQTHRDLLLELAFGGHCHCEVCDESHPRIMSYDGVSLDDEWESGIEADIVDNIEWHICAWCVQSKREETTCENCGMNRWQITRGHHDEQGRYYQTAVPCLILPDGGTEHSMKLKHPYKEATE